VPQPFQAAPSSALVSQDEEEAREQLQEIHTEINMKIAHAYENAWTMIKRDIVPACQTIVRSGANGTIYIGGHAIKVSLAVAQFIVKDPYLLLGISLAVAIGEFRYRGGTLVFDLSSGIWNTIVNNRLTQWVHIDWLKIDREPVTLWDAAMRHAENALSGSGYGAMMSGLFRSSLAITKEVRKAVFGALEVNDEKGAQAELGKQAQIENAASTGVPASQVLPIININLGPAPVAPRAIQDAPRTIQALQDQPAAPFGVNYVRLPPQPIPNPNPALALQDQPQQKLQDQPSQRRWNRAEREEFDQRRRQLQQTERKLQGLRTQAEYEGELSEMPRLPRGRRVPIIQHEEGSGRGRIHVPDPVLPHNDVSNDPYLIKSQHNSIVE